MDISPRKRSKTIALNEHISMIGRDIAMLVGMGTSSISRISRTFEDSGTPSLKGKENVYEKEKLPLELVKLYEEIAKLNPRKKYQAFGRIYSSVEVNTLIVLKMLLEVGR
ncbi:hypothetical protein TNCV_4485891 [Trichonephila clavipes]|nr:hypothetical protein TNCV_4485891 [Trichonephila clavipes]